MSVAAPVIDVSLVRSLVAQQFPQWASLSVRPVEFGGVDNATFHLGEDMSVRLPRTASYALQVHKEQEWLPQLAPHLPLTIPRPLECGAPTSEFPWPWSIRQWLPGETADRASISSKVELAVTLGSFLSALQRIDPQGGPPPGQHNFFRGGSLGVYDDQTREALDRLSGDIDIASATAIWRAGMDADCRCQPVWFHGDVSAGNLLVADGRLCALIDFGQCGVGDPACDLVIAWTFLEGESRKVFRDALVLGDDAWVRGRAWALWKAAIVKAGLVPADDVIVRRAESVLVAVLSNDLQGQPRPKTSP